MFNFYHQEVESLDDFVIDHSHFEKFTIIVPTFNRTEEMLVKTVSQYSLLPNLDRIIVVWNNIGMTRPKLPKMAVPVKFQAMEKNALSNRFTPFESICTTHSAILSVGDDMRIDIDADYQHPKSRTWCSRKQEERYSSRFQSSWRLPPLFS